MTVLIASPAGLPSITTPTDAAARTLASDGSAPSTAPSAGGGKPDPLSFPAALAELAAGDTGEQVGSCAHDEPAASRTPTASPLDGAHSARTHDAHNKAWKAHEEDSGTYPDPLLDAPAPVDAGVVATATGRTGQPRHSDWNKTNQSADQLATSDAATAGSAPAGAAPADSSAAGSSAADSATVSARIGGERSAPAALGQAGHADHPTPGIAPTGAPSAGLRSAPPVVSAPVPSAPPESRSTSSPPTSGAVGLSTPDVSSAPGLATLATPPARGTHDDRARDSSSVPERSPAAGILDRVPAQASELAGTVQTVVPAPASGSTPAAPPPVAPPSAVPDQQPTLLNSIAELRARPDGIHELNVTLHPAELGAVHVRATLHAGTLDVTVACADAGARDAVTAALPDLHHQLGSMTSLEVRLADPAAREITPQTSAGSRDGTGDQPSHREHPPEHRRHTGQDATDPAAGFEAWM